MSTELAQLTEPERIELSKLESIIEHGLQTFMDVGNALSQIREMRLYRETHRAFEEYCRDRWDLSKAYANRLIGASSVVGNLAPIGVTLPANEAQTRPLTKLDNPELQRAAWMHAVKSAPDGHVTAAHVESVVRQMTVPAKPPEPKPEPTDSEYSLGSPSGPVVMIHVKKRISFFALGKTLFELEPQELIAGLSYLLGRGIVIGMVFNSPSRPGQEDFPLPMNAQQEPEPDPEPEPDGLAVAVRQAELNVDLHELEEEAAYRNSPRPRPALSHRELAEELQVPINAVAIVRELMAATSFGATDAHRRFDGDPVAAARHLARVRGCEQPVLDAIDEDVIMAIEEADEGRVLTPEVME